MAALESETLALVRPGILTDLAAGSSDLADESSDFVAESSDLAAGRSDLPAGRSDLSKVFPVMLAIGFHLNSPHLRRFQCRLLNTYRPHRFLR